GLEMRPTVARPAKRSSWSGSSRRRIGARARPHARGGRIHRSIVRSMARPLYSFPLIAPLVLGEVSSGHHAASPYLNGSPHVRFTPIASAVGTAAKRAERKLLRCGISTRLMTGVGQSSRKRSGLILSLSPQYPKSGHRLDSCPPPALGECPIVGGLSLILVAQAVEALLHLVHLAF